MNTYTHIAHDFVTHLKLEGSEQEFTDTVADIQARIEQIIVYTLIEHLSETGRKEFLDALDTAPQELEEKVSALAETVPGLWNTIQKNIETELSEIKQTFGTK